MSRFTNELRGELGAYWKADAEKRLEEMEVAVARGEITIDDNGVARNKIGRALREDQMEILSFTDWKFSIDATRAARDEEISKSIAECGKNQSAPNQEEIFEMRAAFGEGTKVVDVISGRVIQL